MSDKPLPAEVVAALQAGRTIEAIKLLRQMHGVGLKEAKEAVDAQRHRDGLSARSPGELSRASSSIWWIVAAILAVLLVVFLMGRPA